MHADMGSKAVVAARRSAVILPERAGAFGHVELVGQRFIEQLLAKAVAGEQFQPQDIPDKGVGRRDFGERLRLLVLRAEILDQMLPQLGMRLRLGHVEEEGEVLADLGAVGGGLEFAVYALGVVGKEPRLK
jgi:hypothetical protein